MIAKFTLVGFTILANNPNSTPRLPPNNALGTKYFLEDWDFNEAIINLWRSEAKLWSLRK
jgi:hypothetical protein